MHGSRGTCCLGGTWHRDLLHTELAAEADRVQLQLCDVGHHLCRVQGAGDSRG